MKLPRYLPIYIIILFLITLVLRVVLIGYYNNNLGGIELNVVYGIQRLLLGQPLYQDPAAGSYAVIQYTPLYYYFVACIGRLAGIKALDVQSVFVLCRIIALIFNLLTIGLCTFIIRSMGFSLSRCVVFSLPVLLVLTSHYYTRGDSMHLFLFVAAIWAYLHYSQKGSILYIVLAALLTAGCILVKQSGLLCLGITGYCMIFVERRYLPAIIYATLTVIFSGLITVLIVGLNNVHLFYMNTWLGLKNGFDLSFLYSMFISQFYLDMVPFYILGGLMAWFALKKIQNKTYQILAAGAALSFLFAVITGLKKGSSNNYFTEFLIMVLLALPCFLQYVSSQELTFRTDEFRRLIYRFALLAFIILITSKTVGFFSVVYIEKGFKNNRDEYARDAMLYNYFWLSLNIQTGEKIFFTERHFLDNLFIEYAIMPTMDVTSMVYRANNNTYDYSGFIKGMNNGMIKYIVADERRNDINLCSDSLPFTHFDTSKFKLISIINGYCIYQYQGI